MEKLFFDDKFVKKNRTVSCPSCNKEFKVNSECRETFCDESCEHFETDLVIFPEDFVWHPSEKY